MRGHYVAIAILGFWIVGGFLATFGLHGALCLYESWPRRRAKLSEINPE